MNPSTTPRAQSRQTNAQQGAQQGTEHKTSAAHQGETVSIMSDGRGPQLPHERDESSSSQDSGPRPIIEQAGRDIEAGLEDDDLGPPMNDTYTREFRAGDDESGARDAQPRERGGPACGPRVHRGEDD